MAGEGEKELLRADHVRPFAERKLNVHDVVIRVYGDTAWAEFYRDFAAKMKNGGPPLNTKGRETQIYRKGDRGWVIVHIHYSGMPVRRTSGLLKGRSEFRVRPRPPK